MELPKNVTQIGEVGRDCKIYVEDYAISYMKQLNKVALSGNVAVALYGRSQEESGVSYHFVYGASKLASVGREVRHLSQAQLQEIERLRRKNFPDLEFVGYRILDGEMIEGMHLCEQGICRYIGGYARFYEKNDAMLAHMLDVRESSAPEQVDRSKYEEVKKRQDERKESYNAVAHRGYGGTDMPVSGSNLQESMAPEGQDSDSNPLERLSAGKSGSAYLQKMRLAAVGAFALLCLWGVSTFGEGNPIRDGAADATEVVADAGLPEEQKDTLLMEDKLEQALLEENQSAEAEIGQAETEETSIGESTEASGEELAQELTGEPAESSAPVSQEEVGAVAYIVQPGDTLITISWRQYGTGVRVSDICALNNITDPDDIKEGQVIMLPQ